MLYFETYVEGIKWLIIVIFNYYEPYEECVGDVMIVLSPTLS